MYQGMAWRFHPLDFAMARTYERFMCGDVDGARAASARAIELGTVAELEDGEEASAAAPGAPAPAMMPDLAGLRGAVGEPAAGRPVRPATYSL